MKYSDANMLCFIEKEQMLENQAQYVCTSKWQRYSTYKYSIYFLQLANIWPTLIDSFFAIGLAIC